MTTYFVQESEVRAWEVLLDVRLNVLDCFETLRFPCNIQYLLFIAEVLEIVFQVGFQIDCW